MRVGDENIPREGDQIAITARPQRHPSVRSDHAKAAVSAWQPVPARQPRCRRAPPPEAADNSVPLHIQVRETIRRQVRDGELIDKSGRLMTEAELGRHFGVSRITIRNAISPLVNEGMFARTRGRGTFLRSNQPENWVGKLMGFSETIRDAGYHAGAKVLQQGMTNRHDGDVRAHLHERAVWQLRRLRLRRRYADRDRARVLSARHRAGAREARPDLDHHVQRVRGRARPRHQGSPADDRRLARRHCAAPSCSASRPEARCCRSSASPLARTNGRSSCCAPSISPIISASAST